MLWASLSKIHRFSEAEKRVAFSRTVLLEIHFTFKLLIISELELRRPCFLHHDVDYVIAYSPDRGTESTLHVSGNLN